MPATQTVYPTLNPDLMPECTKYEFSKATFWEVVNHMKQPGYTERLEAWKRERDQRQSMARKGEE